MKVLDRFLIRHACDRDARGIAAIHARIPVGAARDGTAPDARSPQFWRDFLSQPGNLSLVSTRGSRLTGFCSLATSGDDEGKRTAELTVFFVDPDLWDRGVGRALLAEAARTARAKGFTRLIHWVRRANARGRDFCGSSGLVADGTGRTSARDGTANDELRLTMAL